MFFKRAVGIDLGTSYSAVARLDEAGRTMMVRNGYGDLLTPSVVLLDETEFVVGRDAQKNAALDPQRVAAGAKRDLGQEHDPRPIVGAPLPPEVLAACVLQRLASDAMAAVGSDYEAVLAVPDSFGAAGRQALLVAGRMAGLPGVELLDDSTAAALALGEQLGFLDAKGCLRHPARVLIYNLGGGTFSVSLVELAAGSVRTLASDGDALLGGLDWDAVLRDYAAEAFATVYGQDPRQDPHSLARLERAAEEAKHTLSVRERSEIHVECAGRVCDVPVTREQFADLTAHLLERTAHILRQLFADGRAAWRDVGHVLLVGGATRMPMVTAMLREVSGLEPESGLNPDEAVARGAAIYAGHRLHKQAPGRPYSSLRLASDRPAAPLDRAADESGWGDALVAHWQAAVMAGAGRERFVQLACSAPARPAADEPAEEPAAASRVSYAASGEAMFVPGDLNDAYDLEREALPEGPPPASPPAASPPPAMPAAQPLNTPLPLAGMAALAAGPSAGLSPHVQPSAQAHPVPGSPLAASASYDLDGYAVAEGGNSGDLPGQAALAESAIARNYLEHYAVDESGSALHDAAAESHAEAFAAGAAPAAEPYGPGGNAADESPDDLENLAYSASASRSRSRRPQSSGAARMIVNLVAHLLSSVLGLGLGYYILCWISPQSNFLHLHLPLLPPPPAAEQTAEPGGTARPAEPPDPRDN